MKVQKARKLPSGSWFIQLRLDGKSIPVTERTEKECIRAAQLARFGNSRVDVGEKYRPCK